MREDRALLRRILETQLALLEGQRNIMSEIDDLNGAIQNLTSAVNSATSAIQSENAAIASANQSGDKAAIETAVGNINTLAAFTHPPCHGRKSLNP